MNARISILPDDYLLSEGLVNLTKGLALSLSLPNVLAKNINLTVWFCFTSFVLLISISLSCRFNYHEVCFAHIDCQLVNITPFSYFC